MSSTEQNSANVAQIAIYLKESLGPKYTKTLDCSNSGVLKEINCEFIDWDQASILCKKEGYIVARLRTKVSTTV